MAVTVKKAILWCREVDNQPGMLANTCRSAPASESGWRGCRVRARTTGRLQNPRDVLGGLTSSASCATPSIRRTAIAIKPSATSAAFTA
jgi:hypothetical protein